MAYNHFNKFILRTPLLPLSFYLDLTRDEEVTDENLIATCDTAIIKESIYLASPNFFTEFEKWIKGEIIDKKKKQRVRESIFKYLSRMASRCTPFGLFAGTVVGSIGDVNEICLPDYTKNKRHTRLDMNFLVAFSQDLAKNETIKNQLRFYPNTSLYKIGHQIRYVEYTYKDGKRVHHIVGSNHNEYLEKVLKNAHHGSSIDDLVHILVNEEITKEEARHYIEQLIESQLLVSELEPAVSGPEFLEQILDTLKITKEAETWETPIKRIQKKLVNLDKKLGNSIVEYENLSKEISSLGTAYDIKFLFQTDMTLALEGNVLDKKIVGKVKQGLRFLNKWSKPSIKNTFI